MSDSIWLSEVMPPGMVNEDGSITPPLFEPRIIIRNAHGEAIDITGVAVGDDGFIEITTGSTVKEVRATKWREMDRMAAEIGSWM